MLTRATTALPLLIALLGSLANGQDSPSPEPATDDTALEQLQRSVDVYRKAKSAVVCVKVTTHGYNLPRMVIPGVEVHSPGAVVEEVEGTGFVVNRAGFIATTYDLVRDAAAVEVRFQDGSERSGVIVGWDQPFGLAVIRARLPEGVTALSTTTSGNDPKATIGWCLSASPEERDPVVHVARLQSIERRGTAYDRYLMAIAPLTPGGAGGPVVSAEGHLLGMAVATLSRNAATPVRGTFYPTGEKPRPSQATLYVCGSDVVSAARDIVRLGHVQRAMLGVVLPGQTNVVDQLVPGGAAEKAGVREGDRLVRVGERTVTDLAGVTRALLRKKPGDAVMLYLERDGGLIRLRAELSAVVLPPPPAEAPFPGALLELSGHVNASGAMETQVTIARIQPGSVMAMAGLRVGDRLLRVNGRPTDLFLNRYRLRPADEVPTRVVIDRQGRSMTIELRDNR